MTSAMGARRGTRAAPGPRSVPGSWSGDRGKVSEQVLQAFYAAGFSRAQALEVVLGAGFSVMANFSGHLVHAPLGDALEPYAWTKPVTRVGDRIKAAASPSAPAATVIPSGGGA